MYEPPPESVSQDSLSRPFSISETFLPTCINGRLPSRRIVYQHLRSKIRLALLSSHLPLFPISSV